MEDQMKINIKFFCYNISESKKWKIITFWITEIFLQKLYNLEILKYLVMLFCSATSSSLCTLPCWMGKKIRVS